MPSSHSYRKFFAAKRPRATFASRHPSAMRVHSAGTNLPFRSAMSMLVFYINRARQESAEEQVAYSRAGEGRAARLVSEAAARSMIKRSRAVAAGQISKRSSTKDHVSAAWNSVADPVPRSRPFPSGAVGRIGELAASERQAAAADALGEPRFETLQRGAIAHAARSDLAEFVQPGDLVIANDAATLPASLHGIHLPSGAPIEVRLAARSSFAREDLRFAAVVFGTGDWRTRTKDRPPPPPLALGDRLALGPLVATVGRMLGHRRLIALKFEGRAATVWAGIAQHGRPIQYAYLDRALALWDVWTSIAALPVAFEPPSAGFTLDWRFLGALRGRGVEFATITLAAGISSTGDPALDARLPFDEPYRISMSTASAIRRAKARGGRVVAVGTTVVRALCTPTAVPAKAWLTSASDSARTCMSSMRSFPGRTIPTRATISCYARSNPTTCSLMPRRRWKLRTTAPTSSAIRF